MFSPSDKLIITGTSTRASGDSGKLVVFDRESLERIHEIVVNESVS